MKTLCLRNFWCRETYNPIVQTIYCHGLEYQITEPVIQQALEETMKHTGKLSQQEIDRREKKTW